MKTQAIYIMYVFVTLLAVGLSAKTSIHNPPPIAASTPMLIQTETPTIIPARDLDRLPTFESLMENDYENCDLPCWWGLTRGETTIDEVIRFINLNELDRRWEQPPYTFTLEEHLRFNEPLLLDFQDNYFDTAYSFLISFGFEDELLTRIQTTFANPSEWLSPEIDQVSLPKALQHLDEIPEIYLSNGPNMLKSQYTIVVVYRDRNSQLIYTFDLTRDHAARTPLQQLCLNLERTTRIAMNLNYLDSGVDKFPPDMDGFDTPENVFGIGTEDFVDFFKEHPDECLDVSAFESAK